MPTGSTDIAIGTGKIVGYFGSVVLFEYLNIPQDQITILAVLMIIDFATGVGKQWRIDPSKITSYRASIGFLKRIATLVSILSIALVFKGLGLEGGIYIKAVLGIFVMAEGYSTIQNVYAIRTGKVLPEYDVISLLLKSLGDYLRFRIEKAVKVATKDKFAAGKEDQNTEKSPVE